jgi:hypothetical protein
VEVGATVLDAEKPKLTLVGAVWLLSTAAARRPAGGRRIFPALAVAAVIAAD